MTSLERSLIVEHPPRASGYVAIVSRITLMLLDGGHPATRAQEVGILGKEERCDIGVQRRTSASDAHL